MVVDLSQAVCYRSQEWVCEAMDLDSSMTLSNGPNGGPFPSLVFFDNCRDLILRHSSFLDLGFVDSP